MGICVDISLVFTAKYRKNINFPIIVDKGGSRNVFRRLVQSFS